MRSRVLVLPLAAAVIVGMVWHKLSQEHPRANNVGVERESRGPAPDFEALDKDNAITRLKTYLGRHNLFVVFFDAEVGAASDETLQHLKRHAVELATADFHVIAVSSALPQQNRGTDFPQEFHLVTDPAPIWKIHREWGCFDNQTERPKQAVFHIDRAGNVLMENDRPASLKNPDQQIDALLGLSHSAGSD